MSVNDLLSRSGTHPSFAHLRRLTDDTGLLEHALGRTPRRREGYTTDDNARALWTVTEWLSNASESLPAEDRCELQRLADIYLAFMLWSQEDNGWFLNNFAYDRTLEPEEISHDCQGRSIWSCADAWIRLKGPQRDTARVIFERSLPTLNRIDSLRGQAFTMAACAHLLEASKNADFDLPLDVKSELIYHQARLEQLLNGAFRHFSDEHWRWFEPAMTYSNGVLPWAMLRTYRYSQRPETYQTGIASLSYLLKVMTTEEGWLRPIGNEGWRKSDSAIVSQWDQQPLEIFKLTLALEEAAIASELYSKQEHQASLVGSTRGRGATDRGSDRGADISKITSMPSDIDNWHKQHYRVARDLCREWFYGENDLCVPMIDPEDGSCCDGLTPYGPNINCGAEATLSYLMTEALCKRR